MKRVLAALWIAASAAALAAPRIALQNGRVRAWRTTADALSAKGHQVSMSGDWSNGSAPTVIWVHNGVLDGGADPRRARFIFGR